MSFFWGSLLGLSLVVCSNASPGLPHGYVVVKSTDLGKSTTYEEIGVYSSPTTSDASATFVPKYDATVVSGKTLPFVTTTDDAGAPVTWIGDWITNSAGSSTLVPVQVCSEVTQPLDGRSKLVQKRDLVCSEVSASTSRPVQTTTPNSPTLTRPTSSRSAIIPASPSPKPNSPTTTASQTTTELSTSSKPTSSTPSSPTSPTSPTKSPTSSSSVQSSTTEKGSESTTQGSTTASQSTSKASGSSSIISRTTPPTSPSSTTPSSTQTSSSGSTTTGSSSSTKDTSKSNSTPSATASTQSTGDSTVTTGTNTGSTTESHSITHSTTKDDKVTSTMTSEPSGFSASTVTNSDWTEDFILTTTIGGQKTEVPVLVDCGDECGDDGAIILFGVPIKTGIQYSLPNLPSFHFPCIFNCGSGGGGGKPGAPEQSEPDDNDDDDDDDQSSTSSSKKTTTSEATTSSSSCTSVMTVSDCIVSCPATASCSKTCFSTMTGCDVTGTTSTTTGDACSFTNTDYRCVNTTASTQTPGVNEVVTYTSVNYDTARAESIEKAQKTQPTTLPWGKGSRSTTTSASPSQTATVTTATRTSESTGSTTVTSPTSSPSSSPTTFQTSTVTSTPPPICSEGNNEKMGFNNEPSSWCFCGGRGPFSTISGSTESYCDFTKLPSETISLTSHTTSINTGCVVTSTVVTTASASETQTYCQCGHVIAGLGTTTMSSGTMLVGCQLSDWVMMSTIQPTTTSLNPSPTEEANCFPTHGENDIDKIIEIVQPDGGGWCSDPDQLLVDGTDPQAPAGNNYISAGWTLADDAPEECQHFDQDATKSLCADPLNEIVKSCPWNGGSIKNVCGEFWMQTCTLGRTCDVGSPE